MKPVYALFAAAALATIAPAAIDGPARAQLTDGRPSALERDPETAADSAESRGAEIALFDPVFAESSKRAAELATHPLSQAFEQSRREMLDQGFEPVEMRLTEALAQSEDELRIGVDALVDHSDGRAAAYDRAVFDLGGFYAAMELHIECVATIDAPLENADPHASRRNNEPLKLLGAYCDIQNGRPENALKRLSGAPERNANALALRAAALMRLGRHRLAADAFAVLGPSFELLDPVIAAIVGPDRLLLTALRASDAENEELRRLAANADIGRARLARAIALANAGRLKEARAIAEAISTSAEDPIAARALTVQLRIDRETDAFPPNEIANRAAAIGLRWRGGPEEREALAIEAEARLAANDVLGALGAWRALIRRFPLADDSLDAQNRISEALPRLVEEQTGEQAIAHARTFIDYVDFAPAGAAGDSLIRQYAVRLVALGLSEEAAALLEHQVFKRLRGAERSTVAADLAAVHLDNASPAKALKTLRSTRRKGLDPAVVDRRRRLEIRALAATGDIDAALALFGDSPTEDALRQRAEILWSAARWAEAARAYKEVFETATASADEAATDGDKYAEPALRAAVAFGLSDDADGLAALAAAADRHLAGRPEREMIILLNDGMTSGDFLAAYRRVFRPSTDSAS